MIKKLIVEKRNMDFTRLVWKYNEIDAMNVDLGEDKRVIMYFADSEEVTSSSGTNIVTLEKPLLLFVGMDYGTSKYAFGISDEYGNDYYVEYFSSFEDAKSEMERVTGINNAKVYIQSGSDSYSGRQ